MNHVDTDCRSEKEMENKFFQSTDRKEKKKTHNTHHMKESRKQEQNWGEKQVHVNRRWCEKSSPPQGWGEQSYWDAWLNPPKQTQRVL